MTDILKPDLIFFRNVFICSLSVPFIASSYDILEINFCLKRSLTVLQRNRPIASKREMCKLYLKDLTVRQDGVQRNLYL